jgi:hypothetical protein
MVFEVLNKLVTLKARWDNDECYQFTVDIHVIADNSEAVCWL